MFFLSEAVAWVYQYLPQGDSIIGTQITTAAGFTGAYQGSGSIIDT